MTTALEIASSEPKPVADEKKCPPTLAQPVKSAEPVAVADEETRPALIPTAKDTAEQDAYPVADANDPEAKVVTTTDVEKIDTAVKDDDVRELGDASKKDSLEDTEAPTSVLAPTVANDETRPTAEVSEAKSDVTDSKPTTPLKPSEKTETAKEKDQDQAVQDAIDSTITHDVADKSKETVKQVENDVPKPEEDRDQNSSAQDALDAAAATHEDAGTVKGTVPRAGKPQTTEEQEDKAASKSVQDNRQSPEVQEAASSAVDRDDADATNSAIHGADKPKEITKAGNNTPSSEQEKDAPGNEEEEEEAEEEEEEEKEEEDGDEEDEATEKPRVQIYGSTVSGNRTYKKQAKELFIMLEANEIDFEFICIAADEKAKSYMRRKALGKMTIPQVYVDGEFKGFFEDAFKANEIDELYEWLGLDEEPFEY
ncbi:hypothetical protein IW140_001935 [Coemansia sp. RSA 1813]|nr:hypothetical protein EV178_001583 [Coemansia sp. RSA 1646]KAJ2089949.1 hypothetical protein IW138_003079 [Coemansia sp. RSA 986]KAJ2215266.1 hypothetical protein EV179_002354 [Coemansia sp. RSA 487]KAJ2570981.1 hypothetical protein IW140_001935 [Coemansia sp. RSA 1813]